MNLRIMLVLITLLALSQAEVVILDDSNFTSYVEENPYVFVKFYAPWCGHCKSMIPEYEKLAEAAEGKEFKVAKVDATVAEKTSSEYKVEGFPTLKFFAKKQAIPYDGGRTADDMLKWIESFFTSKINPLTEEELKQKIGSEDFLLIQGASAEQLSTLQLANFLDNSVEYFTLQSSQFKITLYLKNSKTFEFTGELSADKLIKWTVSNSLPILVPLRGKEESVFVFENEENLPAFLLYKGDDYTTEAISALEAVCEENKSKFKCSYVSSEHQIFMGVARYLKIQEDVKNVSVLAYLSFGLKDAWAYPDPLAVSSEGVAQFLVDVSEGKIEKIVDSEKDKQEREVKFVEVIKLTEDTFNSTLKENKYVFVKFYSPSCGHCVRFAPEYEQLASKIKSEGKPFVITAVDMGEHQDTIGQYVNINGFPTLHFYVNGHKIDYSGAREADAIIKFMESVIESKLQQAASIEEMVKPAVALYNLAKDSPLHLLASQFTRHPIYHIQDDSGKFKAEVHGKEFSHFEGEQDFSQLLQWLEQVTEPLIMNVLQDPPPQKLKYAIEHKKPLLIVVRRDQTGDHVLKVLEEFCLGASEFLCGIARSDDEGYGAFSEWFGDSDNEKSKLTLIQTEDFNKIIYEGDLSELTEKKIEQFIQKAVKQSVPKEEEAKQAPEEVKEETKQESPEEVKVQQEKPEEL